MPTNKDLKRLVRRRMQKTGESYTAARAQLVRRHAPAARPSAPAPPSDYAALAGKSDASVKAATGCTWKRWVDALDYAKADTWPHRKIARYVQEKFELTSWWAQTVTVGYERIRGLREVGQQRTGSFGFTKSRTFPVPVARLFAAFAVARTRSRWMPGVKLTVRASIPHRSMRITWADGTSIEVSFIAKGAGRSSAHVQHEKLPTREASARAKAFWTERLDALGVLLTPRVR